MHLKRLYKALAIVITVAMILPQTWVSTFAEGETDAVVTEAPAEPVAPAPEVPEPVEQEAPAPEVPEPGPEAPAEEPTEEPTEPTEEPTGPTEEPTGPTEEPTEPGVEDPGVSETPVPEPTEVPEVSETPTPGETPTNTPTPSATPTNIPKPSKTPTNTPTPTSAPSATPTKVPTGAPEATTTPDGNSGNGGYSSNSELISAQQIVMPPITMDEYRFTTIEKVYAIAKENLIVREEQDIESREIGKLQGDGLCFIIKDIEDSEWVYIESGEVRGFLKTEYLTMGMEALDIVNDRLEENMALALSTIAPEDNKAFAYIRETVYETKIEKTYAIAIEDVNILEGIIEEEQAAEGQSAEVQATEAQSDEVQGVETQDSEDQGVEAQGDEVQGEEQAEEDQSEGQGDEAQDDKKPRILGELPKGGVCYILATEGEWVFVEAEDVRGFVKADQLIVGAEAEKQLAEGSDWTEEKETELEDLEAQLSQMQNEQVKDEFNKEQAEAIIAVASSDTDAETLQEVKDKVVELEAKITAEVKEIEEQTTLLSELKAEKNGIFGKSIAEAPQVKQLIAPEDNEAFYYTLASAKETSVAESIGRAMIEFASQFLGNPYVWGGTSLTNGADCSGFVQGIYSQFGYSLPRTSGEQSQVGMQIPVSEARTGDLIFYARNGVVYHVVMYIDNGQVIHASSRKTGIITSGIDMEHAVWATRMISDDDLDKVAAVNAKAGPMMYGGAYTTATAADKGELLGNFKLTAYCNCVICCGKWAGGPTASGTSPVEGRTVAMAGVPFGTRLIIGGKVYTVEDRGTPYGHVDIYMNNHDECNQFGVQYADVYVAK